MSEGVTLLASKPNALPETLAPGVWERGTRLPSLVSYFLVICLPLGNRRQDDRHASISE